jgi:hypothetical protein
MLLEIPSEPTEGNLSTLEFDLRRMEAKGNDEYQGCRGFHTLSKEGGNLEFWYRMNEAGSIEAQRILELWLQIRINF